MMRMQYAAAPLFAYFAGTYAAKNSASRPPAFMRG